MYIFYFFQKFATDPRAKQYPFMDNPLPTFGMVLTYLSWVLIIGPIYMRDRKPMSLRSTLIYYNAGQVLLSSYMFYEHLMSGWLTNYNYSCETVDYNDTFTSRRVSSRARAPVLCSSDLHVMSYLLYSAAFACWYNLIVVRFQIDLGR